MTLNFSTNPMMLRNGPKLWIMAVLCSIFSKTKKRGLHFGDTHKHSIGQELFSQLAKLPQSSDVWSQETLETSTHKWELLIPMELPSDAGLKAIPCWTHCMGTLKSVRWQGKAERSELHFLIYDEADDSAVSLIVLWTHSLTKCDSHWCESYPSGKYLSIVSFCPLENYISYQTTEDVSSNVQVLLSSNTQENVIYIYETTNNAVWCEKHILWPWAVLGSDDGVVVF